MRWRTFFFWNALGGVAWATSIGLAAYLLGPVAKKIIEDFGIGAIALVVVAIAAYLAWRWHRSRPREGGGRRGGAVTSGWCRPPPSPPRPRRPTRQNPAA